MYTYPRNALGLIVLLVFSGVAYVDSVKNSWIFIGLCFNKYSIISSFRWNGFVSFRVSAPYLMDRWLSLGTCPSTSLFESNSHINTIHVITSTSNTVKTIDWLLKRKSYNILELMRFDGIDLLLYDFISPIRYDHSIKLDDKMVS